jgi:hypothetical protein
VEGRGKGFTKQGGCLFLSFSSDPMQLGTTLTHVQHACI